MCVLLLILLYLKPTFARHNHDPGIADVPQWINGPQADEYIRSFQISPRNDRVLYFGDDRSGADPVQDLYTNSVDGGDEKLAHFNQLGAANGDVVFEFAGWSPDGYQVAYGIFDSILGRSDLWVASADADGTLNGQLDISFDGTTFTNYPVRRINSQMLVTY